MKVKDIMKKKVIAVRNSDSVFNAAKKMRDYDIGSLPVFSGDDLVGFVTDRDIVIRCCAEGIAPVDMKVEECMTNQVCTVHEDESLETLDNIFRENKIQRIVVVGDDSKMVGIANFGDMAEKMDDTGRVCESLCEIKEAS